jgi:hypothetical protein
MSTLVEVALVGSVKKQKTAGDMIPASELRKPYRGLIKVALHVSGGASLGEIAREAMEKMGAPDWAVNTPSFDIGFYRPEDENGVEGNWSWFISLVDDRGRARWTYPVNDVTFAEVVRAAEAGAVQGDPTRIHVAMTPHIGDGVLPMWPEIIEAYRLLKEVLEILGAPGALYASYQLIKNMRDRSGKAVDSLERRSSGWAESGGNPHVFEEWLDDHAWEPKDLARLLDCSEDEAEAVLWAMGFGADQDGRWRRGVNPEARLMDGNRTLVIRMGLEHATDQEVKKVLRDRIEATAKSGTAPPPPEWRKLPWMQRQMAEIPPVYRFLERPLSWWYRLTRR